MASSTIFHANVAAHVRVCRIVIGMIAEAGALARGWVADRLARTPAAPAADAGVPTGLHQRFRLFARRREWRSSRTVLGLGGFASVHLVEVPGAQRVAIKSLHASYARNWCIRGRFQVEFMILRGLSSPYFPRAYRWRVREGIPEFSMEYVPGRALTELLDERSDFPLAELLAIGGQAVEALLDLSASGYIHGDVSPSNVLVVDRQQVKLIDLGFATPIGHCVGKDETIYGTRHYMAPEWFEEQTIALPSLDVFSLGVILHQCACKCMPYVTDDGSMQVDFPGQMNRGLAEFLRVVEQMLRPLPDSRPTLTALRVLFSTIQERHCRA